MNIPTNVFKGWSRLKSTAVARRQSIPLKASAPCCRSNCLCLRASIRMPAAPYPPWRTRLQRSWLAAEVASFSSTSRSLVDDGNHFGAPPVPCGNVNPKRAQLLASLQDLDADVSQLRCRSIDDWTPSVSNPDLHALALSPGGYACVSSALALPALVEARPRLLR